MGSDDSLGDRKLHHGRVSRSLPASQRTKAGKFFLSVVLVVLPPRCSAGQLQLLSQLSSPRANEEVTTPAWLRTPTGVDPPATGS